MTLILDTNINLSRRYGDLIKKVLDGDSVYIRTKEVLTELLKDNELDSSQKKQVIIEVMGNLNGSVVSNAMSLALEWEVKEKQLWMQKEELKYKLDFLKAQTETESKATSTELAKKQELQAKTLRLYGTTTTNESGDVTALGDTGQIHTEMLNTIQDTTNKSKEQKVIEASEKNVYAGIHKTIADTYMNYGMYTGYTISATGITGTSPIDSSHKTLSYIQGEIGKEQAKGYVYNAWANSATSASSMIGVALGSENAQAVTEADVASWRTVMNKLGALNAPTF